MIVLYYHKDLVHKVVDSTLQEEIVVAATKAVDGLKILAETCSDQWIVWCDKNFETSLDIDRIKCLLTHRRLMISHNVGENQYLSNTLGYVEESPFIPVFAEIIYPTWQMSGIGAILGEVLQELCKKITVKDSLLFTLNSFGKLGQQSGLICLQAPLIDEALPIKKATNLELFKFVSMHYKKRWSPFLLLCMLYYDKKIPLYAMITSLFFNGKHTVIVLPENDTKELTIEGNTVDVLIPTIGRKRYLYNVLEDLKSQTILPKRAIIIEQNPEIDSSSTLDFINNESWPFEIKHIFIHQTGACNARNLGLQEVESDWLFMADDDIRFEKHVIEDSMAFAQAYTTKAFTLSCLQKSETEKRSQPIQWNGFGSGCSFVASEVLKGLQFDPALEHGFGEDADFGNQLRKKGIDIIYNPNIKLLHLKAPVGGFREPIIHPWVAEQPKPSPTVMLSILKHWSVEQRQSYKLTLWSKFYRLQTVKNPFTYLKMMRRRWRSSLTWAAKIQEKHT